VGGFGRDFFSAFLITEEHVILALVCAKDVQWNLQIHGKKGCREEKEKKKGGVIYAKRKEFEVRRLRPQREMELWRGRGGGTLLKKEETYKITDPTSFPHKIIEEKQSHDLVVRRDPRATRGVRQKRAAGSLQMGKNSPKFIPEGTNSDRRKGSSIKNKARKKASKGKRKWWEENHHTTKTPNSPRSQSGHGEDFGRTWGTLTLLRPGGRRRGGKRRGDNTRGRLFFRMLAQAMKA